MACLHCLLLICYIYHNQVLLAGHIPVELDAPLDDRLAQDGAQDVVTPSGFAWAPVPPAMWQRLPYAAIGRLELYDQSGLFGAGTAWLVGRGTAVTAAHNFRPPGGGATREVRISFPAAGRYVLASDARIHPQFRGQGAAADPWDVACVQLPALELPALSLNDPGPPPAIPAEVPGFPNGQSVMVSHVARAFRAHGQLMVHSVDTATGHSGAPMLDPRAPASAIAIHVGGFASNPFASRFRSANTALPMRPALVAFIQDHLNHWG